MKLIHCSDLHIDAAMTSRFPPEKARARRAELLDAFRRICDYASENGVGAVIIAGDLFDGATSRRSKKFILETVGSHHDTDFFVLCGNHDRNTFDGIDDLPENLKLLGNGEGSFELGNVTVTGAADGNSLPERFDPDKINVAVLHGEDGKEFDLGALAGRNIDYLALGHYHSFDEKKIDDRGVAVYSGCVEGRGFDEIGDKGFVLLEVSGSRITHEFVPFSTRKVLELSADLTRATDLSSQREKIISALTPARPQDIVRLNVVGGFELGREKFYDSIVGELKDKYFYIECEDNSKLIIDPSDYKNDISLKGEFIRLVMKEVKDETERGEIIELGLRALRGDDLE